MALQCWMLASPWSPATHGPPSRIRKKSSNHCCSFQKYPSYYYVGSGGGGGGQFDFDDQPPDSSRLRCLGIRIHDFAAVADNKVLLGAVVSAAIGQLSKPLTRVLLYGDGFDPKAALQAGGFPSSHSTAVAATATALALDRGLSDSVFGFSVVVAGLIMYDAQGVRREVGNHAKEINRVLRPKGANPPDDSVQVTLTAKMLTEEGTFSRQSPAAQEIERRADQVLAVIEEDKTQEISHSPPPLRESIGHSEIEVIAGAVLGVSVSLALHILWPHS